MIIQKRVRARSKNQVWNIKRFYRNVKRISVGLTSKAMKVISLDNDDFDLEEQVKLAFAGVFGALVITVLILVVFLQGGN